MENEPKYYEVKMPNVLLNAVKQNPLTIAEKKVLTMVFKKVGTIRSYFQDKYKVDLTLADNVFDAEKLMDGRNFVIRDIDPEIFIENAANKTRALEYAWETSERLITRALTISKQDAELIYGDSNKRLVNMIMEIGLNEETGKFEVHLSPRLVQIVLILQNKLSFTLGDFEFLMQLSNDKGYAWEVYWLIREKQYLQMDGSRRIELQEFKNILGIGDKYENRNDHFKHRILDPAQERLKGTWAEFDYTLTFKRKIKKHFIYLRFKSDIHNQVEKEMSVFTIQREKWVVMLKEHGIDVRKIHEYKKLIEESQKAPGAKEMPWCEFYIVEAIKKSRVDARERKESKHRKDIKSVASHIIKALEEGYYVELIEKMFWNRPDVARQLSLVREEFKPFTEIGDVMLEAMKTSYGSLEKAAEKMGWRIETRDGVTGFVTPLLS